MCLIQAVRTGAMEDCVAALEENAILEWLTPGYYKILGETDDVMNEENLSSLYGIEMQKIRQDDRTLFMAK